VLPLLSRALEGYATAFAREVLREGSLLHVVAIITHHDALFREGARLLQLMVAALGSVCTPWYSCGSGAWEDAHGENSRQACAMLLEALEEGLDCDKPHVRRAVIDALLSLAPSPSPSPSQHAPDTHPAPCDDSSACGSGGGGGGGGGGVLRRLALTNVVRARALGARARCDADALVSEAGLELYVLFSASAGGAVEVGVGGGVSGGSGGERVDKRVGEVEKEEEEVVKTLLQSVQSKRLQVCVCVCVCVGRVRLVCVGGVGGG